MDRFDLIEWQGKAKAMSNPKDLFELWNTICNMYDKGQVGKYEFEEMRDTINPLLIDANAVKRLLVDAVSGSDSTSESNDN